MSIDIKDQERRLKQIMKEAYETLEMEIIAFEAVDVITASCTWEGEEV